MAEHGRSLGESLTLALRFCATFIVGVVVGWAAHSALHGSNLAGPPPPLAPPSATPHSLFSSTATPPELVVPVSGVRPEQLVDTFTQSRAGGARHHDAIDIMAPRGTPVIAATDGKVVKLFLSNDGGNTVYVRSPDGRIQYYRSGTDHSRVVATEN